METINCLNTDQWSWPVENNEHSCLVLRDSLRMLCNQQMFFCLTKKNQAATLSAFLSCRINETEILKWQLSAEPWIIRKAECWQVPHSLIWAGLNVLTTTDTPARNVQDEHLDRVSLTRTLHCCNPPQSAVPAGCSGKSGLLYWMGFHSPDWEDSLLCSSSSQEKQQI